MNPTAVMGSVRQLCLQLQALIEEHRIEASDAVAEAERRMGRQCVGVREEIGVLSASLGVQDAMMSMPLTQEKFQLVTVA